ncbi:class I SAM-dependent methyltransferase [Lachnospiraceae bacterium 38-10]
MNDNKSAFKSNDYDRKITQTLPFYELFYEQVIELVKIFNHNAEFCVCDVQELVYMDEFNVITAIQVNHYLRIDERRIALKKCYEALKDNGVFISFENFAPFTNLGKYVYLEKWKKYQMKQGKSFEECQKHINRYKKDYFPISLSENLEQMRNCEFQAVEILWLSNMQVGLWGIK